MFTIFLHKSCKQCTNSVSCFHKISYFRKNSSESILPTINYNCRYQLAVNVYVLVIIWWQSLDGVGEIVGDETRSGYPPPCWLQRRHFWDFLVSFSRKYPDTTRGGKQTFSFSPQIPNPKILGLVPISQSADFYGFYPLNSPKSRLLKWFFVVYKSEYAKFVRGKGICLTTCGSFKFAYKKNHWVRKSQIRIVPHLRKTLKSNKSFKSAKFRTCDLLNLFVDYPPLNTTVRFRFFKRKRSSNPSSRCYSTTKMVKVSSRFFFVNLKRKILLNIRLGFNDY